MQNKNLTFTLTEKETQACEEFRKKHKACCPNGHFSTLGMQYSYIITPGGLGSEIEIKCNKCGEIQDVTSSEDW